MITVAALALSLLSGQSFIDDNTALPGTKVNAGPIIGPADENLSAPEFNTITSGLYDVRTVIERNQSIWSYGAVCDGGVDDQPAFLKAIGTIRDAGTNGILTVVAGTCKIAENLTVPPNVTLEFDNNAELYIPSGVQVTMTQPPVAPPVRIFLFPPSPSKPPVAFANPYAGPVNSFGVPLEIYPQWWGAKADGVTDSAPGFQEAVASFGLNSNPQLFSARANGQGGILTVPAGYYVLGSTLKMGSGASGMTMRGAGMYGFANSGTTLEWTQTDGSPGLDISGEQYKVTSGGPAVGVLTTTAVTVDNLTLFTNTQAGETLSIGERGSAGQIAIRNCSIQQYDTSYALVGLDPSSTVSWPLGGNVQEVYFDNDIFNAIAGMGQDMVRIVGTGPQSDGGLGGGQTAEVTFVNALFNGSLTATAPMVLISNSDQTGIGLTDILFENTRMEEPYAGMFDLRGAFHTKLINVIGGDTGQTSSAPMIKVQNGTGNLIPTFSIDNFWTDIGNATHPTIAFVNGSNVANVDITDSTIPYLQSVGVSGITLMNTVVASYDGGFMQMGGSEGGVQIDGLTGIPGISFTQTPARNLRGQFTVSASATTGTATFVASEPDTNYFLSITPTANSGSYVAGSTTIEKVVKGTGNFAITVQAAPSSTQTFDWILIR
jgi:hypothetical protein